MLRPHLDRLWSLLRGERGLDEELRFHVEKQTEANVAKGMAPEEARRQALVALGGIDKTREECRDALGLRLLTDLAQDIRYALRQLRRSPGFTAVAVLTLALGIGANTAVFSVINAVLLRPLPYHDADRLVDFQEADEHGKANWLAAPNFLDFQRDNHVFEQLAAYTGAGFVYNGSEGANWAEAQHVSHNMFATLGIAPALGGDFTAADADGDGHAAILSWPFWQAACGGDPRIIGQTIRLNGKPYEVRGVMPRGFRFPYTQPVDLWTPLVLGPEARDPGLRGGRYLVGIGRLRPGVTVHQAGTDTRLIAQRNKAGSPPSLRVAGDVSVVGLRSSLVGDARRPLILVLGAVGFVLLIAAGNLANLLLGRATVRRKEMAMRAAIGASRYRLIRQTLTESTLLAGLGGAAGLLAGVWGTRLLLSLSPADLPGLHDAGMDLRVLAFTAAASLGTGLLFGLAPAFAAAGVNVQESLKQSGAAGRTGQHLLRNGLVVAEIALSLALLAGAGLLVRSFLRLLAVPPGFDPQKVLVALVSLDSPGRSEEARRPELVRQLVERIETIPGVISAGASTNLPLSNTNMICVFSTPDGSQTDQRRRTGFRAVTPGYLRTLAVPLVRGRFFEHYDAADAPPVAIINQTMARRYWPGEDPIGKHIVTPFRRVATYRIVGIVHDMKYAGLDQEATPEMFVPFAQLPTGWARLAVRTHGDPAQVVSAIRSQLRTLAPDVPLWKVSTMQRMVSDSVAPRRFYMVLLSAFAGMALLLALAGIYGVVSYAVAQRTHEIGVRMALGAGRRQVLALVVAHGLRLALAGVLIGLGGALAATRLLATLLFGVSASDPATFAAVSLALALAALAASYFPARGATKVHLIVALRCE
jgi:predicted permease